MNKDVSVNSQHASEHASERTSPRIVVVLHRPIYPRNIGMCARAMANMGVERLVLISPQFEIVEETKQGAAHAQEILRRLKVYPDVAAFRASEGEGIRIALSGRDSHRLGAGSGPGFLDSLMHELVSENDHPIRQDSTNIYLLFGPEDDGLSADDMELCHHICRLPTFGEITSLNLSHAVLLSLYIVQTALGNKPALPSTSGSAEPEVKSKKLAHSSHPVYYPSETIKSWLESLGFDLSGKKITIEKTLNRILLSRSPTSEELRIVDTVLQQTVRKLRKKSGDENDPKDE
jgi:tRNA/rRNA methyltransferase